MKNKHRRLNLLPFYFRNIGLGIIGIALFSALIKLTGNIPINWIIINYTFQRTHRR